MSEPSRGYKSIAYRAEVKFLRRKQPKKLNTWYTQEVRHAWYYNGKPYYGKAVIQIIRDHDGDKFITMYLSGPSGYCIWRSEAPGPLLDVIEELQEILKSEGLRQAWES